MALFIGLTGLFIFALGTVLGLTLVVLDRAQNSIDRTKRGYDMWHYRTLGEHQYDKYEGDEHRFPWCFGYFLSLKQWVFWTIAFVCAVLIGWFAGSR